MRAGISTFFVTALCGGLAIGSTASAAAPDQTGREILPVPPQPFTGVMKPALDQSTPVWSQLVKAPQDAPNILLVMTDDVGFGASSTFGGPIPTPNLDRLAKQGARYNNFHTTAMCSPTRAALLTGRNHHGVGTGALTDIAMGFPGYNGEIPATSATIGRVLLGNGYSTAWFGKHHNVPGNESSMAGPFSHWPTGLGFEEFYGFIGAETDQFRPTLYHGTQPVNLEGRDPALMLDKDLVDHAIRWLHRQHAAAPEKPFFLYYAPGSAHAPHQAPPEWIARFKGKFDNGWDAQRAQTVARQETMGIVPNGTDVTPRPAQLPAWDSLSPDRKRLYARYMEVYAAMLAYQDDQFGRLLDELERTGQLSNTLIVFIEGDNGASGEGGPEGTFNELAKLTGNPDQSFEEQLRNIDQMGGPDTYQVYPAGWAWAMNAPFPLFKQIASHLGGTRNGLVVTWPGHINQPEDIRDQFHHVNDIMPTLLEAAGVPAPKIVDGSTQHSLDGVSMTYTFKGPTLPGRHDVQYFELLGNRAIYRDGWLASTNPGRMPWELSSSIQPQDFTWSLYDLKNDFAQTKDLAASEPKRLADLKALFDSEAKRNNVYPLRANLDPVEAARMRRPEPPHANYVFWGGDVSLAWAKQPMLAGGFTINCDIIVPDKANGALVATGSNLGGWSFALRNGRPIATHAASSADADQFSIQASAPLPAGTQNLGFVFIPDSTKPGSGGILTMTANGQSIGQGRIGRVSVLTAGPGETFDIGDDNGRPVMDYAGTPHFDGEIKSVRITLGAGQ